MRKQQVEDGKSRSCFVGMSCSEQSDFALAVGWDGQSPLCEDDVLVTRRWGSGRWGCELQAERQGRGQLQFPRSLPLGLRVQPKSLNCIVFLDLQGQVAQGELIDGLWGRLAAGLFLRGTSPGGLPDISNVVLSQGRRRDIVRN